MKGPLLLLLLLSVLLIQTPSFSQPVPSKSKDGKISGLLGVQLGAFIGPVKQQIKKLGLVKDGKRSADNLLVYTNVALDDHTASLVTFKIFRNKLVEIFVHFKSPTDTTLLGLFENLRGDVQGVFGKASYDDRTYDSIEVHSAADELAALRTGKGRLESYWVTPNADGDYFNSITLFIDDNLQCCMRVREGKLFQDVKRENVQSLIEDF